MCVCRIFNLFWFANLLQNTLSQCVRCSIFLVLKKHVIDTFKKPKCQCLLLTSSMPFNANEVLYIYEIFLYTLDKNLQFSRDNCTQLRGGECYINSKTFVFYQVTDWLARSFDDFFGNTNISSSAVAVKPLEGNSGRNRQRKKKDLSSVPESSKTKALPRKRAKTSSVDLPCNKSRQNWSQSQDEPWVDRYKPETQVWELF